MATTQSMIPEKGIYPPDVVPPQIKSDDEWSFAWVTLRKRIPIILVGVMDSLMRNKKELYKFGMNFSEYEMKAEQIAEIEEEAKEVIKRLAELRIEVESNGMLIPIDKCELPKHLSYFNDDVYDWNRAIFTNFSSIYEKEAVKSKAPHFQSTLWLLAESYVYRRVMQIMLKTTHLRQLDPFAEQKQLACKGTVEQIFVVADYLRRIEPQTVDLAPYRHERDQFRIFMRLVLWANKCDLSHSNMRGAKNFDHLLTQDIEKALESLDKNILANDLWKVWRHLLEIRTLFRYDKTELGLKKHKPEECVYIDLVADNSGYELYMDLMLFTFIVMLFIRSDEPPEMTHLRLRLHVKRTPCYVSDAHKNDIKWLLRYLCDPGLDSRCRMFAMRWRTWINTEFLEIHDHPFWTLPYTFHEMPSKAPDLYETLKQSSMIFVKGDLNYRRLVGDRPWNVLVPLDWALRDFKPAPICCLRTIKSDPVVGIDDQQVYEKIAKGAMPENWRISGEYGLIQYWSSPDW